MTASIRESATIYQFPARGRFASAHSEPTPAASGNVRAPKSATKAPVKTVIDGAWYHDEAIAEERLRRF
jgi:hypothetical protein